MPQRCELNPIDHDVSKLFKGPIMRIQDIEVVKTQATLLNVDVEIINYDVNRFSVVVGGHSYTSLNGTLTAMTTTYLRADRKAKRKAKRRI